MSILNGALEAEKNVIPLGKHLLLEHLTQSKTKGGLHLPETAKQDYGLKVLALGEDVKKKAKVGDLVAVDQRGLSNIKMEGIADNLLLCHEDAVLAAIRPKK